jgi:hypothetical protein
MRTSSRMRTLVGSPMATVSTSCASVTGTTWWLMATWRGSTATVAWGTVRLARSTNGSRSWSGHRPGDLYLIGEAEGGDHVAEPAAAGRRGLPAATGGPAPPASAAAEPPPAPVRVPARSWAQRLPTAIASFRSKIVTCPDIPRMYRQLDEAR